MATPRRTAALLLSGLLSFSLLAAPTAAPTASAATGVTNVAISRGASLELQRINQERTSRGLRALKMSQGASNVAVGWSKVMSVYGMMHNKNLSRDLANNGVTGWRSIGENVGYGKDGPTVHRAFMNSSGHRANILSTKYQYVGIGVFARDGRTWVTLDFVGY